jgi:hypothetical protein
VAGQRPRAGASREARLVAGETRSVTYVTARADVSLPFPASTFGACPEFLSDGALPCFNLHRSAQSYRSQSVARLIQSDSEIMAQHTTAGRCRPMTLPNFWLASQLFPVASRPCGHHPSRTSRFMSTSRSQARSHALPCPARAPRYACSTAC